MLKKQIIGRKCLVSFKDDAQAVLAKVNTGVNTSIVWASDIRVDDDDILHFKLFAPNSEYFTGKEYSAQEYSVTSGATTEYKAKLSVMIDGRNIKSYFSLSDRENANYPVVIGRRALKGCFLVDVEKDSTEMSDTEAKESFFSVKSLQKSPREFFKNYYQKKGKKK